jgi:hypothetical protein
VVAFNTCLKKKITFGGGTVRKKEKTGQIRIGEKENPEWKK